MNTSKQGKAEIMGHEAIINTKYRDSVGVWTIGIGATKSEIPDLDAWPMSKRLTDKECVDLFLKGLVKYEKAVNGALKVGVSQEQFDALVSITYNIGVGGMKGSTFMKRINNKESLDRIHAAIMMWTKQRELVGRRLKEAKLYMLGEYSNKGMVLADVQVNSKGHPVYSTGININALELLD